MTKKVLSLEEFNNLAVETQVNILHQNGAFVGKRKLHGKNMMLFQLNGFYVEVFYKRYRQTIDHLIITGDTEILEPYLDKISIKHLEK